MGGKGSIFVKKIVDDGGFRFGKWRKLDTDSGKLEKVTYIGNLPGHYWSGLPPEIFTYEDFDFDVTRLDGVMLKWDFEPKKVGYTERNI